MEDRPGTDGTGRSVRLPAAYYKVHSEGRHVSGSPSQIDWKMPVLTVIVAILIAGGIGYAVYDAEPVEPWLDLMTVRASSDEGYVYLALETRAIDAEPPWEQVAYRIGIDTYERGRGATTLPPPGEMTVTTGIEFLLEIGGPGKTYLQVVEGYDPYNAEEPIVSPKDADAGFRRLSFVSNRVRFSRDGTKTPAIVIDRGNFRYGTEDRDSEGFDTRTDISIGEGLIEMRIPWGLLNVSDPSSRRVLHSESPGREDVGSVVTDGFRFYVMSYRADADAPEIVDAIPAPGDRVPLYEWARWETPQYRMEPKLGFDTIREAMTSIPDYPQPDRGDAASADTAQPQGVETP